MKIAHEIVNITEDYSLDFLFVSFEFILFSRSAHLLIYAIGSIAYFLIHSNNTFKKFNRFPSNHIVLKKWFFLLCGIQVVIALNSIGHMFTVYGYHFSILGFPSVFFRVIPWLMHLLGQPSLTLPALITSGLTSAAHYFVVIQQFYCQALRSRLMKLPAMIPSISDWE